MRWEQPVQYASITDIGFRRRNNQHSLVVHVCPEEEMFRQRGHLFLVADGMGGHAVGELASKIAADTIPHIFYKTRTEEVPQAIRQALEFANAAINERGTLNREFERMGTTCTALVLGPKGAVIGHVGDSRVYRIRDDRIDQLSFDHSLQWELLRQGKMKPEEVFLFEPRNVITRSLGPEPKVQVDVEGPYPVLPGDTFLLCSDGLTGHVNDSEIGMIVRELAPGEACRLLVNLANLRGGSDNITIVIAKAGPLPDGVSPTAEELSTSRDSGPGWGWLAAFWTVAIVFAAGVLTALFGRVLLGTVVASLGVAGFLGLAFTFWRRRRNESARFDDGSPTTLWKPYRTASARLSRKFLVLLASIEAELLRTAEEEGWTIDRERHDESFKAAQQAASAGQTSKAFREYARAIDVLMTGVHSQRKQMQQQSRAKKAAGGE